MQRRSAHRRRGQNRKQKFGWGRGQGQKHLEDDDSTNEDTELVGKINSFSALLATALLLALHTLREQGAAESLAAKFLERGVIPPLTLFLFCWGLLMILNKFFALWWERRTFAGVRPGSVLLASFQQLQNEHSAHGLDYFLDLLWKKSTDFYTLPRYINWAIPSLGFIGTVLGISLAAEGIQSIIGAQGGLAQMSADLG